MSAMGPPTSGGALQSLAKASEECSKTLPDGWSTFDIQKLNSEIEELNKILSQLQIQKYFLTRFSELSVDRHWEHHEKTIGNILDIFQTTDGAKQKIRERKQRLRSLKPEALIFLAESFPTNVICSRPMDGGFEFLMKYVEGFVEKTLWARKWLFSDQVKELVREIRMESIQKGNPIEDEKAWYAFLKGECLVATTQIIG